MVLYQGPLYQDEEVTIGPVTLTTLRSAAIAADVRRSVDHWFAAAQQSDDILYFGITDHGQLVGQILLHNIDRATGEALVGYHLFAPRYRGQGIGTRALGLLVRYVRERTNLRTLTSITGQDNIASQRIAQKCGFHYAGMAREDPENLVVHQLNLMPRDLC